MKTLIQKIIQIGILCAALFVLQQKNALAQFPCGGQILNACNCEGAGVLVADSNPCTFNSTEQQVFLLVDDINAIISTDADDELIVDVSNTGAFFNVQDGDYLMYSLTYNTSDAILIQTLTNINDPIAALQTLGTESPTGTWTNTNPTFTLTATALSTVNGPACNCPIYTVGNYIWADFNSNGQQESNEPGIPNVTVHLYVDADGDGIPDNPVPVGKAGDNNSNLVYADSNPSINMMPFATTTTNANGYYFFINIPDGDYVIQIDLGTLPLTGANGISVNWTPTAQDAGSDFSDSDFNNNGYSNSFRVDSDTNPNIDGGFTPSIMSLATELINFEGVIKSEGNQLSWATASETDNDYFSIMRSDDGIDFNIAGTVDGAGNSSARKNYLFLDKVTGAGTSYYQLTNTDESGKTAIASKTIALTRELAAFELTDIRPVPAVDVVNIAFASNASKNIDIKVFNLAGQQVFGKTTTAQEGNNQLELNVKDYVIGVYFVTITDGKNQLIGKFIKN